MELEEDGRKRGVPVAEISRCDLIYRDRVERCSGGMQGLTMLTLPFSVRNYTNLEVIPRLCAVVRRFESLSHPFTAHGRNSHFQSLTNLDYL